MAIDLNCDMGEGAGEDEGIVPLVSSINEMFDRAAGGLQEQIGRALATGAALDPAAARALELRTGALLTQAGAVASELVARLV